MTSEARELSLLDGEPLLLFRFFRNEAEWRYTTADSDVIHNNSVYRSVEGGIRCSGYSEGPEIRKLTRTITLPSTMEINNQWWPYPPSDPVMLTILLKHADETDAMVDWTGRVTANKRLDDGTTELKTEPTQTASRKFFRSRCWQRGCNHVLYSQGCNVDPSAHVISGTVFSIDKLAVRTGVASMFPLGRLIGGIFEYDRPGRVIERRGITAHTIDTVWLERGAPDLVVGSAIRVYPGCALTTADCENYFHNLNNYGGFPWLPQRSPFDGMPVW